MEAASAIGGLLLALSCAFPEFRQHGIHHAVKPILRFPKVHLERQRGQDLGDRRQTIQPLRVLGIGHQSFDESIQGAFQGISETLRVQSNVADLAFLQELLGMQQPGAAG